MWQPLADDGQHVHWEAGIDFGWADCFKKMVWREYTQAPTT
jgi:hypothetical protein